MPKKTGNKELTQKELEAFGNIETRLAKIDQKLEDIEFNNKARYNFIEDKMEIYLFATIGTISSFAFMSKIGSSLSDFALLFSFSFILFFLVSIRNYKNMTSWQKKSNLRTKK